MDQIFGYEVFPGSVSSNDVVFQGARPVLAPTSFNGKPAQVNVFSQSHSYLQNYFSQKYTTYAYVCGIPVHPVVDTKDIPEWCVNAVSEKRYDCFKELIGTFVIIIDEPVQHRITFVTDILGIRPIFIGDYKGRIVFGSSVWPICKAGLSTGVIDYDAVSAWISYGFNCTNGSLFSDLRRLPPATVVTIQNGKYTEIPYGEFKPRSQKPNPEQVVEELHCIVSSTFKTLLSKHSRVSLALSGGFDSRYLLALSSSVAKTSFDCVTLSRTGEEKIASKVAETLGFPLEKYSINGSTWDIYDDVYHFTADGFPITKFLTYCIAQKYPDIPMVNGFLGGGIFRGEKDIILGKYETEWKEDLADVLQSHHSSANFKILRKDTVKRIKERSRVPMEVAVQKGSSIGKVFGWTNSYYRQRLYISNNFLQHINITEALLPFYSWGLFAYKMEHDYSLFNRDVYNRVFQTYFPKLANIPHSSDLPAKTNQHVRIARCTKQWARELLPKIINSNWLSLVKRRKCVPLNMAAIAGLPRAENAIFFLERLYLLEKKVRDSGLDFDWECI